MAHGDLISSCFGIITIHMIFIACFFSVLLSLLSFSLGESDQDDTDYSSPDYPFKCSSALSPTSIEPLQRPEIFNPLLRCFWRFTMGFDVSRHDSLYPDAKFISTLRANDSDWLTSIKSHTACRAWICHELVYGASRVEGHEKSYLEAHWNHTSSVKFVFGGKGEWDAIAGMND